MALKPDPGQPDRLLCLVPGLSSSDAQHLADDATAHARVAAPKMTGDMARRFVPVYGDGYFGIHWQDKYAWYQDRGIKAFTMHNLAGKTIPMWINDQDGSLKDKNPKADTRVTEDGRRQTLIFRRAARIGQRRFRRGVDIGPASYPGAPGRIGTREAPQPWTAPGKVGGRIAQTNVGVRWRHPGLRVRDFLMYGLVRAATEAGIVHYKIMPFEIQSGGRVVARG